MILQAINLKKLPELLAPAGSPEALAAAIAAGADAVYLSGKRFGARKFAANFDEAALARAIDYAHLREVRVYVTVNTLIRENELCDVAEYLLKLYLMGADAVLLQDLGASLLASQIVPELEKHASTQMTIHNRQGVAWAADHGFKRAVLAREVGLDEIKEMDREMRQGPKDEIKRPAVGLEVFVHGALCYSYSGQCLLSSAIGGRSGNRGMCAQPCRKPYVLLRGEKDRYGRPACLAAVPQKERYLISTRDLCLYRHLDRIIRAPIQSLKIEGRMKSAEYVAIVTSIYKRALLAAARGQWSPSPQDERELALSFNRDFTEGYLLGAKDVMGREMSDNRGVLIGSVASFDTQRSEAAIRLTGPLCPEKGDGLVIQSPGQETGLVVQRAMQKDGLVRLITPERVRPGAKVYLTGSSALAKKAQEIIASARTQIPLDLTLAWQDENPLLQAALPDGSTVQVKASFKMEKAKSRPTSREQIESQMRKTGQTPFLVRKITMDYAGDLFAPLSALNQMRRDLLEKAQDALIERRRPPKEMADRARNRLKEILDEMVQSASADSGASAGRVPSLAVYADSLETVKGAVEGGCHRLYFEPILGQDGKDRAAKAAKLINEARAICGRVPLIWKWPRITHDQFFAFAMPLLTQEEIDAVMVENVGAMQAAMQARPDIHILGASGLNVCNHLAAQALAPPLELITLSPELSYRQLSGTVAAARRCSNPAKMELMVQGSQEVTVSRDCMPLPARAEYDPGEFWGLQDMRRIFPLRLDDDKRTHIFNSTETCLLDQMPEIFAIGLDGVALDARGRTEEYAREMTEIYRRAIDLTEIGSPALRRDLESLKESIRPLALGGITHGHFQKGLKDEIS
ncbi:MAG: Peptidase family U32 [Methanosaeta sp. PtaU1.Bin112]|nr:MAG: Peptidase family U32 [Methanosaeta sp. PtaU1.Bin112]